MNNIEPDYEMYLEAAYQDEQFNSFDEDNDLLPYDLTNEGNEDAWLDAAYEDRFADGYEPEWEY